MLKTFFILLFLFVFSTGAQPEKEPFLQQGPKWKGSLRDTAFTKGDSVWMEVLESGKLTQILPFQPFQVNLPPDTMWNICFATNEKLRCWELIYTGTDSVFQVDITGEDQIVLAKSKTDETPARQITPATDSLNSNEPEFEQAPVKNTSHRLQKVILRVRRRPERSLGKSVVSAKLIKRLPGLAEADVIRAIQNLPGVVASSDFSSKIYVRGGGSDQNLFLLDNGVVYSPVHFFGLFSTFLVEGLEGVEFYKGGFQPEYGNRLSSVVDIKTREGGNPKEPRILSGGSVKVSTFATQLHAEGNNETINWHVAGRSTYIKEILDLLKRAGATDLTLDYRFTDLQGNIRINPDENHQLSATVYHGRDELNFFPIMLDWGNTVIPVNFFWNLENDMKLNITTAYTSFDQSFGLEGIFNVGNDIQTYTWKPMLTYEGIENHRLAGGLEMGLYEIKFANNQEVVQLSLTDSSTFFLYSPFIEDEWVLGDHKISGGVRLNYSSALPGLWVEPRLSWKWDFIKDQSLESHVGRYVQFINSIEFSDQENLNEFYYPSRELSDGVLNPSNSLLFSLGYNRRNFPGGFDFVLEGYYKTLNNLLVFAPSETDSSTQNNFSESSLLGDFMITGEGYSVGWETSVRKERGNFFGGISFSQGYAVFKEENNPEAFHPRWHQPYSLKADLGINWKGEDGFWKPRKKGRFIRSSSQLKLANGLPYTEFVGTVPAYLLDQGMGDPGGPINEFNGDINILQGARNQAFVPAYFRWDIKPLDIGREGKWNISLTFLNVTDHENILLYFYDRTQNPPVANAVTQFPFFPLLINYEYRF